MKASSLKFGLEVECYLPNGTIEQLGGYHHGLQVAWLPDGWNAQSDGSLCSAPSGYRAAEIVSPILDGEEGLAQVWYTIDAINELHGVVNETCGLHIHLDGRQLTRSQVNAVAEAFRTYEKAFYGLCGVQAARRWNNTYCLNSTLWNGSRYQSLNLTNWLTPGREVKKTLEIRCFSGSLDPELVLTAVYMAVGLVVSVVNGKCTGKGYRINDPVEAAKKFVATTFVDKAARIYEECTVNEVTRKLIVACRQARI